MKSNKKESLNSHSDQEKKQERIEEKMDTPVIPEIVYNLLPTILKKGTEQFHIKRERDIFLLGSIALLSGAMPNVYGIYDRKIVRCPLYLMVIAPPASGKGVLSFARAYLIEIEKKIRTDYQNATQQFKLMKSKEDSSELVKPVLRKLIIPANSSSAAFMRTLKHSGGKGIMFETEADTLSITLSKDWGNYSDMLRKAFHHEEITSSRLDQEGTIEIQEPALAVLISGTFDQVTYLKLDNPTNGLQSRFLFYLFDNVPYFKDVSPFAAGHSKFDFKSLGQDYMKIYSFLENHEHEFRLTNTQWQLFQNWFATKMKITVKEHNMYAAALVTRLGINAFRILMVLSILRSFENGLPAQPVFCSTKDVTICHHLMETLLTHSMAVFSQSLFNTKDEILSKYIDFLDLLPKDTEFTRKEALDRAGDLFAERTIDRRLSKLVKNGFLTSPANGKYLKAK